MPTLFVSSDGAADTISVTAAIAPAAAAHRYNFTVVGQPGPFNADDIRVFGYGGNDDITLNNCATGWVSGNTGDDKITLIDCNRVSVTPLTPSEFDGGVVPLDGVDTIDVQNSTWTNANGGDSDDIFTASGDCSNSVLAGGPGKDTFTVGATFSNGQIHGDADDDTLTGSGNWPGATVYGGGGNDWLDLRACTGLNITIFGNAGDDDLYAGTHGSNLYGGQGWDWMVGGAGDDNFYAVDSEFDIIRGGAHVNGDYAELDAPIDGRDVDWFNTVEFIRYVI